MLCEKLCYLFSLYLSHVIVGGVGKLGAYLWVEERERERDGCEMA